MSTLTLIAVLWVGLLLGVALVAVRLRSGGRGRAGLRPWLALSPVLAVPVFLSASYLAQSSDSIRLAEADFSRSDRNSVSGVTDNVLEELDAGDDTVTLTAFLRKDRSHFREVVRLLERYDAKARRLKVRFVDPDANAVEARQYGVSRPGEVFAEVANRRSQAELPTEIGVTTAIVRALNGAHQVCWSTGHGEAQLDDPLFSLAVSAIGRHGFTVEPFRLADGPAALEDCDVVAVVSPQAGPLPDEAPAWAEYLGGDGRALLLLDPEDTPAEAAQGWLAPLGVTAHPQIVQSRSRGLVGEPRAVVSQDFPSANPVTQSVPSVFFLGVGALTVPGDDTGTGLTTSPLIKVDPHEDAPVLAAALDRSAVTGDGGQAAIRRARTVVVADTDWVKTEVLPLLGNEEMLVRAMHWIVQAETLIAIPGRQGTEAVLALTSDDIARVDRGVFVLPPLALLTIAGARFWVTRWRRRHT